MCKMEEKNSPFDRYEIIIMTKEADKEHVSMCGQITIDLSNQIIADMVISQLRHFGANESDINDFISRYEQLFEKAKELVEFAKPVCDVILKTSFLKEKKDEKIQI